MAQKPKEDAGIDRLLHAIRCIELECRLLLIASAVEGFQLQAADIGCVSDVLLRNINIIKTTILEV